MTVSFARHPAAASWAAGLIRWLGAWYAEFRSRRRAAATWRRLSTCPDYLLRDVGVLDGKNRITSRAEIAFRL